MFFEFRDDEPKNKVSVGTVIVFQEKYLIVGTDINHIQALSLSHNRLVGSEVKTEDSNFLSRKEFDELIDSLPGNTTASDWTFHTLDTSKYTY